MVVEVFAEVHNTHTPRNWRFQCRRLSQGINEDIQVYASVQTMPFRASVNVGIVTFHEAHTHTHHSPLMLAEILLKFV